MAVDAGQAHENPPEGVILPLDVVAQPAVQPRFQSARNVTVASETSYSPDRQRDRVRLVVTSGLLLILGYLVVFSTIESTSTPAHWSQTKEMLQILLPALTGIIGTVIGFYFGTAAAAAGGAQASSSPNDAGR